MGTGTSTLPRDEEALLRRLKANDESAFAEVVRLHAPRMLAVARRFLQQEQDAQDAVQDAFLSAFRSIDKFQGDARLSTWLHRIAVNSALLKLRQRRRVVERPIEDLLPRFGHDGHLADPVSHWMLTYDTAVQRREIREQVRHSIDQLPDSFRTVLLLRDIEGHSTEETAELLGISDGAVKTRLHRARQSLRTLLDPYMRGDTA